MKTFGGNQDPEVFKRKLSLLKIQNRTDAHGNMFVKPRGEHNLRLRIVGTLSC